jgi:hypothetical protein
MSWIRRATSLLEERLLIKLQKTELVLRVESKLPDEKPAPQDEIQPRDSKPASSTPTTSKI